jgi:hypothetical protein
MELNKTIPFIIETQWLATLGASPAGFWWRFGILSGTISVLPVAEPTRQLLSLLKMDRKAPTVTSSAYG